MKANEFDKKFDEGEKIIDMLDLSESVRVNQKQKQLRLNIPLWMADLLEKEAKRLGVSRQAMIKIWLSERLEKTLHRNQP